MPPIYPYYPPSPRITNRPEGGGTVGVEYEPLVRPYEASDPYATSKIRRLIARKPGPFDGEANARWGRAANFELRQPQFAYITTNWPDDDDPEDGVIEVPVMEFVEVDRAEEEHRVENPDDATQYVIEARPTYIIFRGPDLRPDNLLDPETGYRFSEIFYKFTYDYPAGPV